MSECGCVYVDGYDSPREYYEKNVALHRDYKCGECGAIIKKGVVHEFIVGNWGTGWDCHHTCQDCISIRDEFFCDSFGFGMVLGDLAQYFYDADGRIPSDCIANLPPGARRTVCDVIEDVWDDINGEEEDDEDDEHDDYDD